MDSRGNRGVKYFKIQDGLLTNVHIYIHATVGFCESDNKNRAIYTWLTNPQILFAAFSLNSALQLGSRLSISTHYHFSLLLFTAN